MIVTVHHQVAAARHDLRRAGLGDAAAELDARLLAQHVLGWDTSRYFSAAGETAPPDFAARYEALVRRRVAREPLAYIVGRREFWGLSFEVTPAVLIPRPETEVIVETVLERACGRSAPMAIADACTGSGCLAVVLASEFPQAQVVATDLSEDALTIARQNARRHGVHDRIRFVAADLLPEDGEAFDLIVANPPYVAEGDRPAIQPEVRDYEPSLALFANGDGLGVIRRLVPAAAGRLRRGGALIVEFGSGQDERVADLIGREPTLRLTAIKTDLQGIPRAACAERVGGMG